MTRMPLIFVMTLFTFDDWYPFRLRGVRLSRNSNKKSCKSRIMRWQNSKSRITLCCPVPPHADNLGSITRHTANLGAITRHANTFFHPLNSALWPDSITPNIFFFA